MIERSHVRFAGRPYEPSHKLAKGKVRLAPASLHVMAMFGPGVSVHVALQGVGVSGGEGSAGGEGGGAGEGDSSGELGDGGGGEGDGQPRPVLRPRLCYVLQLLAGCCVTCYSFWQGSVLRVTALGEGCVMWLRPAEQQKGTLK